MCLDDVHFFQDDVCVETEDGIKHCKLIAVHAGLEKDKDVKQQLEFLRARDTRVPRIEALSDRQNVWNIPKVMALYLLTSAFHFNETFPVYCPMILCSIDCLHSMMKISCLWVN